MANQTITPAARNELFGKFTRQHIQTLPKMKADGGNQTLTARLPKARLLSKISLDVNATVNIKHASKTSVNVSAFTPYQVLRRISISLNNGFSPYVVSGRDAAMLSLIRNNPDTILPSVLTRSVCYFPTMSASSAGKDNTFNFSIELPITLNQRDPIGLILLQNESTTVDIEVDICSGNDFLNNDTGYSVEIKNVEITPIVETFTIPALKEAYPDLSVIKLVNSKYESFEAGGPSVIKLNVGTIYRKLMFYFEDENGIPLKDEDFTGNLELIFNQADIPYSIVPRGLAHKNASDLGYPMPEGLYVFDFTFQGLPNLGGARDYVDTEKLTEFWFRFNSAKKGKVTVIDEKLARLVA